MPGNEKQSQPKRASATKKPEMQPQPLTFGERDDEREQEENTDEDIFLDDNPHAFDLPRSSTSSIRINNPTGPRRYEGTPSASIGRQTQRRTGQGIPPSPNITQARPMRNTMQQPLGSRLAPPGPDASTHRKNKHWLLYVGIGMIAALALWVVASTVLAWATAKYNDITYGNPRTFQIDAVVGHGGDSRAQPSHFVALNLHGQVIVIELMAGNPAKSVNYTGPDLFEQGGDQIPVTLEFRDVTRDNRPDMLIHIQSRAFVFVNDGTKFRPANGSDKISQ